MLEVRNLTVGYSHRKVLSDLCLQIPDGQLTVVVGPNGCGKTTLLKALTGILPNGGEVWLDGTPVADMSRQQRAKAFGYLPQGRNVPEITARRLVLHGRFPHLNYPRTYGSEDRRIAEAAMDQMGISHLAERMLPELSGGERQKVYIAMVLAQQTPVILMDEPTGYLDIAHRFELLRLARELVSQGKTVLLVLHELELALGEADQLVVMANGKVMAAGTPEAVYESGILERVFSVRQGRMKTETGMQYYFQPKQGG